MLGIFSVTFGFLATVRLRAAFARVLLAALRLAGAFFFAAFRLRATLRPPLFELYLLRSGAISAHYALGPASGAIFLAGGDIEEVKRLAPEDLRCSGPARSGRMASGSLAQQQSNAPVYSAENGLGSCL